MLHIQEYDKSILKNKYMRLPIPYIFIYVSPKPSRFLN
jgi:hypothetical protein